MTENKILRLGWFQFFQMILITLLPGLSAANGNKIIEPPPPEKISNSVIESINGTFSEIHIPNKWISVISHTGKDKQGTTTATTVDLCQYNIHK